MTEMKPAPRPRKPVKHARTPGRGLLVTDRRQRWLELYIETGNAHQSARMAGYSDPYQSARKLKIEMRLAIDEAASERISSSAPRYLSLLEDLAVNAVSEQVRFAALRDLLDRGKLLRAERHIVDRFDHMSESELWRRLVDAMGHDKALAFMGSGFVVPDDSQAIPAESQRLLADSPDDDGNDSDGKQ